MSKKTHLISVEIDRLIFDTLYDRYLLVLKQIGRKSLRSIILPFNETDMIQELLFASTSNTRNIEYWLDELGVKIEKIIINKRVNGPESAECIVKRFFGKKTIMISSVEAVFLALDKSIPLKIAPDIIDTKEISQPPVHFDDEELISLSDDELSETIDLYSNEVIM